MEGFKEKYLSYGRFTGSVTLRISSAEDTEVLEGFFQKSFHGKHDVRVTAAAFRKALASSRFSSVLPEEILQAFYGETLQGRKEQAARQKAQIEETLVFSENAWESFTAASWIREINEDPKNSIRSLKKDLFPAEICPQFVSVKSSEHADVEMSNEKGILRILLPEAVLNRWKETGDSTKNWTAEQRTLLMTLFLGAALIEGFPCRHGEHEYLPVFAARMTGDPHFFDNGTAAGNLLYLTARWMEQRQGKTTVSSEVFPSFRRQRTYLNVGIIQGDSSNYAMLYGVRAFGKEGTPHQGMEGFSQEQDMVQVPLHVIEQWTGLSCPDHKIWIVENPSVYSILCHNSRSRYACMCMNGQPKLSSLRVLDLLAASGVRVFYAGDFDPEGLLIAQKLKKYYNGTFHYWHMEAEDCRAGMSGVPLSETRLRSLSGITDPALQPAAEVIRKAGCAGYQENLWHRYLVEPGKEGDQTIEEFR